MCDGGKDQAKDTRQAPLWNISKTANGPSTANGYGHQHPCGPLNLGWVRARRQIRRMISGIITRIQGLRRQGSACHGKRTEQAVEYASSALDQTTLTVGRRQRQRQISIVQREWRERNLENVGNLAKVCPRTFHGCIQLVALRQSEQ